VGRGAAAALVASRGVWRRDANRLWTAFTISAAGSSVGMGALPIIAVLVLHAPVFEVSLLTTLSGVAGAAMAMPVGPHIEVRRKRPIMMGADLTRFVLLGSVPVAAAFGVLSYPQLCLVGIGQTAANVVFGAASGAHLKALVPGTDRTAFMARFETTSWVTNSAGPPAGGLLISWLGGTAAIAIDAVSFLGSAIGIRRLRSPEPAPPARVGPRRRLDLTSGWRYIRRNPELSGLFWNTMIFGGAVMMVAPLLAVFLLDDLHATPWQYGLVLGVPCLGGVVGSRLAPRLTARWSRRRVLLLAGTVRTVWLAPVALAGHGTGGLVTIVAAETAMMTCAGLFNPVFAAHRLEVTDDAFLARTLTAWSVSSKTVQPLFMAAGGAIAAGFGVRAAIGVAAVVLVLGIALLPWRLPAAAAAPPAIPAPAEPVAAPPVALSGDHEVGSTTRRRSWN